MPHTHTIAFLGTSRSGLGHLRRMANVAQQIALRSERPRMILMTNGDPGALGGDALALFAEVIVCPSAEMSRSLSEKRVALAVADTMALPDIGAFRGQSVLILRETPQDRLTRLARDDGRDWDLVLVPNAPDHWMPDLPPGFARSMEAVGWIRRPAGCRAASEPNAGIVLATGGGGTAQTRAMLYPLLSQLLEQARARLPGGMRVRQALGPRASGEPLPGVDEVFDPGAELNDVFRAADVVISTAGYNSVLELASTDTPALLVPIPRSFDDQARRVALWGPRLGFGLGSDQTEAAAAWLADQVATPRRRAPFDLGPDGSVQAADRIWDLLCPVS